MNVVSEILIWRDGEALFSQLTTNASWQVLAVRLDEVGLLESVAAVEKYFGDRADGGSGYVIRWASDISRDRVRSGLRRLC